jgi:hypothetical protein
MIGCGMVVVTMDEPEVVLWKVISADVGHTVWDWIRRFRHLLIVL